jgi:putative heme transporter
MSASQVSLKTVFTVCFGVLAVVALVYAVLETQLAIALSLLAALIAIALHRLMSLFMRWGMSRGIALFTTAILLLGVVTIFGAVLVPPAVSQAQVLGEEVPALLAKVRKTDAFTMLDRSFGVNAAIDRFAKDAPAVIFKVVNAVLSLVAAGVTVLFLAVFMLIFGGPLIERILVEVGLDDHAVLRRVLDNIYRSVGGYITGITVVCWINSIMTTIFLAIIGMPFFLPLAIMSGTSSLVPYVGSIFTSITITVLALAAKGPWPALACAVYFVTYGQIEGNILGPLIFRRTVHVNPLVTTLSILFFGEMAGIMGAFAAIPVVAALQIVLREIFHARRQALVSSSAD